MGFCIFFLKKLKKKTKTPFVQKTLFFWPVILGRKVDLVLDFTRALTSLHIFSVSRILSWGGCQKDAFMINVQIFSPTTEEGITEDLL